MSDTVMSEAYDSVRAFICSEVNRKGEEYDFSKPETYRAAIAIAIACIFLGADTLRTIGGKSMEVSTLKRALMKSEKSE